MGTFVPRLKAVGLTAWQCGLFVVAAIALAMLFAAVLTEQALRHLCPWLIAHVPDQYRQMLLRLVPPPPKCVAADSVQAAE